MSAQKYLVTARKYRPRVFGELVAQEHVTETLRNAIRLDRLAHAYLFAGPRGVGKTTAARILAKAINCTSPASERASEAEPCRRCDSCRSFEEGRSLNIIEIDAASNNKVDDVRDLRETVRVPPQGARKKVYIVDEVHMLTTQAFNALLKTLEEPPPHVLFIFATTEPRKVLPTILSRCQRFDFRRIPVDQIVATLSRIAQAEDVTADEASLLLIARKGDGSLRDALSVFDQSVSLCGTNLRYAELARALGVVDVDLYFEVSNHVASQHPAGMLHIAEQVVRSGYDLQEFLAGLAEHLRNLLVARTLNDDTLIEATETTKRRYMESSRAFSEVDLLRLLTLTAGAEESIRSSTQPRLRLEMALLNMASISRAADLREALTKIDRLEALAGEGRMPRGKGAVAHGASGSGTPAAASGDAQTALTDDAPAAASGDAQTALIDDAPAAASGDAQTALIDDAPAAASGSVSQPSPGTMPGTSSGHAAPGGGKRDAAPSDRADLARPAPETAGMSSDFLGTPAIKRRKPGTPESASSASALQEDVLTLEAPDTGPFAHAWSALLEDVKADKIQVWSLLHHTVPEGYEEDTAIIAVPNEFHQRLLSTSEEYVVERLRSMVDVPLAAVRFVVREGMEVPGAEETASDFDPYEYMRQKRQENPVIKAIFDQFGGELVW